jgi:hypothetical protein
MTFEGLLDQAVAILQRVCLYDDLLELLQTRSVKIRSRSMWRGGVGSRASEQ